MALHEVAHDAFHALAHRFYDREDYEAAVAVFSSAAKIESGPRSALDLVLALGALGRCADADAALALAYERGDLDDLESEVFAAADEVAETCREGERRP